MYKSCCQLLNMGMGCGTGDRLRQLWGAVVALCHCSDWCAQVPMSPEAAQSPLPVPGSVSTTCRPTPKGVSPAGLSWLSSYSVIDTETKVYKPEYSAGLNIPKITPDC